jgi:DNA-directed RNA polymerase subunit RPC12/RpoP
VKTLEEYNAERWKAHEIQEELGKPHPNNIKCPNCGAELWDSRPNLILTSYPPQKDVHCPVCGYKGYRLA